MSEKKDDKKRDDEFADEFGDARLPNEPGDFWAPFVAPKERSK